MCGISGFFNLDGRPAEYNYIDVMSNALAHRGPDESGYYLDGPVALGIRRLSIIDIHGGHQPMNNDADDICLVFNGEIYNSPGLQKKLRSQGHIFKGHSDTEVILHQYEESGATCSELLSGMFAYAILDKRRDINGVSNRLVLARDRLGIKPLFTYQNAYLFAFSSELTSLLQHPEVSREIDPYALHQYLSYGTIASPLTIFKNIQQLLPGQLLIVDSGKSDYQSYWKLPTGDHSKISYNFEDSSRILRELLSEVIQDQLLSDVPVGAFLSGGMDSSTIVALMAQSEGLRIPTFSIRFEELKFDESKYSRQVSGEFGTDHHELTIPNLGYSFDLLLTVLTHHGQPTADTSAIPTFLLSKFARNFVKVVLSGDGGDESFAGYNHFGWTQRIDALYRLPRKLRLDSIELLKFFRHIPGFRQSNNLRQLVNAFETSLTKQTCVPLEVLRINNDPELASLLMPDWAEGYQSYNLDLLNYLTELESEDSISRSQLLAFHYYLPDGYLTKVDRMSMANALEVRVPMLDHRIVEFSMSLPSEYHWNQGIGKHLLRNAMSGLLPQEILEKPKQGFSIPLNKWITKEYLDLAQELLSDRSITHRGIFNVITVRNVLDTCLGRTPHYRSVESDFRLHHRLYMLVMFELWCRNYLDTLINQPTESLRWL